MKLIIFDVYGTLISTGKGSLDAAKKILALQDKEINPQEFFHCEKNEFQPWKITDSLQNIMELLSE